VRSLPVGIDEPQLTIALREAWGLEVDTLEYVPEGGGSYHWRAEVDGQRWFVTADDLHSKPWLGHDADSTFDGLRGAFDVALALHEEAGCEFVVAPVRTAQGLSLHRVSAQYSLAVFPFIDGEAGAWGAPLGSIDRTNFLGLLAQLHGSTATVAHRAERRGLDLPGRTDLEDALGAVGRSWPGGPFSERARAALAENVGLVTQWLSTFDDLTEAVVTSGVELVVTHGEPHPGNVMRSGGDLLVIDWDTVGLAPPERDLWMFDDGADDGFGPYVEATGRDINTDAIELYRLTWTLADLAAFVAVLRAPHARTADTEKAWKAFSSYLP
jgi:spectinomycin phosphotransferase